MVHTEYPSLPYPHSYTHPSLLHPSLLHPSLPTLTISLTPPISQGIILSSFYWGYVLTQIIGGHLSDRYGGDLMQWVAAVVWSLAALSITYVTHVSGLLVILARFLIGMAQGMPSTLLPFSLLPLPFHSFLYFSLPPFFSLLWSFWLGSSPG